MASYLTALCIASSFSHTKALGSSHPTPQFNSQQSFTRQRRRLFDRKMGAQKGNTEGMDEFRERVRSAALRSGFRNVRVTGSSRQRLTPDRDLSPQFTGQSDPGPIPPLRIMAANPSLPSPIPASSGATRLPPSNTFSLRFLEPPRRRR